jgi:pimeloyl-ACP methyl ester carboxylesterase
LLAACTVGPSTPPPLATSGEGGTVTAATTASSMPLGAGGPGRTAEPITWGSCSDGIDPVDPATRVQYRLQCAEVDVPKVYTDESAGRLSVAVVRVSGPRTPADAPPLFVVRGDPGENGTDRPAAVAASVSPQLLEHFAVVVMDVRGTGGSVAIDCVSGHNSRELLAPALDPSESTTGTQLTELSRSLTFDCGDMVGPELSDYSTVLATDDLDSVRAALGRQQIDFLGQGFGATLGAVYADRYPGRVAAAVLDGPADPSLTAEKQALAVAAAQEQALASFAASCPTFAGGCPLGTDPAGAVRGLVTSLGNVGRAGSDGYLINGGTVLLALAQRLGSPSTWPQLATALARARSGNLDGLSDIIQQSLGRSDIAEQQSGRLIYQCNDSAGRLGGAELAAAARTARTAAPLFGPFDIGRLGVCASWPATETAIPAVRAAGAPPLLVLGAVSDPVAPYSSVRSLTTQLESATLLTWQSGTHGAYPASACVAAAVNAYLLGGTVPAVGTLCPP